MVATANQSNPYEVAWSGYFGARLRVYMRDYEQAETLAARALELAEKNQFPQVAAMCPMCSRSGASRNWAARPKASR